MWNKKLSVCLGCFRFYFDSIFYCRNSDQFKAEANDEIKINCSSHTTSVEIENDFGQEIVSIACSLNKKHNRISRAVGKLFSENPKTFDSWLASK